MPSPFDYTITVTGQSVTITPNLSTLTNKFGSWQVTGVNYNNGIASSLSVSGLNGQPATTIPFTNLNQYSLVNGSASTVSLSSYTAPVNQITYNATNNASGFSGQIDVGSKVLNASTGQPLLDASGNPVTVQSLDANAVTGNVHLSNGQTFNTSDPNLQGYGFQNSNGETSWLGPTSGTTQVPAPASPVAQTTQPATAPTSTSTPSLATSNSAPAVQAPTASQVSAAQPAAAAQSAAPPQPAAAPQTAVSQSSVPQAQGNIPPQGSLGGGVTTPAPATAAAPNSGVQMMMNPQGVPQGIVVNSGDAKYAFPINSDGTLQFQDVSKLPPAAQDAYTNAAQQAENVYEKNYLDPNFDPKTSSAVEQLSQTNLDRVADGGSPNLLSSSASQNPWAGVPSNQLPPGVVPSGSAAAGAGAAVTLPPQAQQLVDSYQGQIDTANRANSVLQQQLNSGTLTPEAQQFAQNQIAANNQLIPQLQQNIATIKATASTNGAPASILPTVVKNANGTYQTSDGQTFLDPQTAQTHQQSLNMGTVIDNSPNGINLGKGNINISDATDSTIDNPAAQPYELSMQGTDVLYHANSPEEAQMVANTVDQSSDPLGTYLKLVAQNNGFDGPIYGDAGNGKFYAQDVNGNSLGSFNSLDAAQQAAQDSADGSDTYNVPLSDLPSPGQGGAGGTGTTTPKQGGLRGLMNNPYFSAFSTVFGGIGLFYSIKGLVQNFSFSGFAGLILSATGFITGLSNMMTSGLLSHLGFFKGLTQGRADMYAMIAMAAIALAAFLLGKFGKKQNQTTNSAAGDPPVVNGTLPPPGPGTTTTSSAPQAWYKNPALAGHVFMIGLGVTSLGIGISFVQGSPAYQSISIPASQLSTVNTELQLAVTGSSGTTTTQPFPTSPLGNVYIYASGDGVSTPDQVVYVTPDPNGGSGYTVNKVSLNFNGYLTGSSSPNSLVSFFYQDPSTGALVPNPQASAALGTQTAMAQVGASNQVSAQNASAAVKMGTMQGHNYRFYKLAPNSNY